MYIYNDYNYVNHILSLPYEEGLNLYTLCIGRLNNILEEKDDNKLWDLYLFSVKYNNFEGSFENYKETLQIKNANREMSKDEAKKEYDRISRGLDHIVQLDKKRRKKKSG